MARKTNLHVVKTSTGWAARLEGQHSPVIEGSTQTEVANSARSLLQNTAGGGELTIHRPNGEIRAKDTVNRQDPHPPKG